MKKLDWRPLGLVLLLFLALQLPPMLRVSIAQYDESIFLDIARNIHTTGLPLRSLGPQGQLELDQTPLYLYLLSGLTLIFGENLFLLRLVTLAAAAGCILMVYVIAGRARGWPSGLVAALLLALSPFFNLYSFFLRMEVFTNLFLLLAIFWLAEDQARLTSRRAAAAGTAMATAVLLKVVAVTFWMAALPWALWRLWRAAGRWPKLVWLALPTLVGLGLWVLALWLDPARAASAGRWGAALGVGGNAVDVRLNVQLWNWILLIVRTVLGWEMVALLIVALVAYAAAWRKQHPLAHLLVVYIGLTVGLSLFVQLKEARHLFGTIPAVTLLIGIAIPWQSLLGRARRRPTTAVVAGLAAAALLWSLSPLRLPAAAEMGQGEMWWSPVVRDRYFHNDARLASLRDAGVHLAAASPDDAFILIARQGPIVGYYAGRHYTFLYTGTFDRNMALLREGEFLVMDPPVDFWAQTPEESEALLGYVAGNYTAVRVFDSGDNTVTLYRRNPGPP
ncbi:MAG: glycosyltransferase family 39 protein [Candidatus Promineofilum sp.]|nr:glycosyltransferase family 39 protein [Promineifilum sp.]